MRTSQAGKGGLGPNSLVVFINCPSEFCKGFTEEYLPVEFAKETSELKIPSRSSKIFIHKAGTNDD